MNDVARNRAKLALVVILMLILFSTLSVAKVDANVESSDLHNTIYNGLMSSSSSIDVKRFNLSPDDAYDAFFKVLNDNPELFYVQYGCRVSIVGNKVVTIIPTYHMTGTALVEAKKEFNTFVNDIIKGIPSTFSDIEKVIYVHDYIVANYSYDNSYSIYDAYNFFKQKKGVCQAYSFAFMAILNKLNIPVSVAESSMMNHMWNVVKIDGQWYHVDVTWDDPVPDKPGRVSHENFLRSDDGIRSTGHYGWTSDYTCTSTKYDKYLWKDATSPLVYLRGKWYYMDEIYKGLFEYDIKTNTGNELFWIKESWPVVDKPGYTYMGCYSGLGVYNGYLYYNTPTKVYRYDVQSGQRVEVASHSATNGYVYFFTLEDNILTYYIRKSPNDNAFLDKVSINLDTKKETYSITYKVDGLVYITQMYTEGEVIKLPSVPKKTNYDFIKWEPAVPKNMPNRNIVVNAVFEKQECKHTTTKNKITEATCTSTGKKEVICNLCGEVVKTESIPKINHKYGDWIVVKQPTVLETGLKKKVCSLCGQEIKEELPKLTQTTPAPSHTPVITDTPVPSYSPIVTDPPVTSTLEPTSSPTPSIEVEPTEVPVVTDTPEITPVSTVGSDSLDKDDSIYRILIPGGIIGVLVLIIVVKKRTT